MADLNIKPDSGESISTFKFRQLYTGYLYEILSTDDLDQAEDLGRLATNKLLLDVLYDTKPDQILMKLNKEMLKLIKE